MTPRNSGSKKMTKVIAVLNKNNAKTIEKLHLFMVVDILIPSTHLNYSLDA